MCLFPKLIKNPKYKITTKNNGNVPEIKDERVRYVPIGCGLCMECVNKKSSSWKIRLYEEIKTDTKGLFVTLTFNDTSYDYLLKKTKLPKETHKYVKDNEVATLATRRFLERWRKKHKKSIKHWLITELGTENTERIHLHGILFTDHKEDIKKTWTYGYTYIGEYVNNKTINYITKYITKSNPKHKNYQPKILTTPGIGKNYINTPNAKRINKYKGRETDTTYRTREGTKLDLPIYYRNLLYTEEQREKLWLYKLDEGIRYVGGEKINAEDETTYVKLLQHYQRINEEIGYGNPNHHDVKEYIKAKRKLAYIKKQNKKN